MSRAKTCDNCKDSSGPQPSGRRQGASMRCTTRCAGMTSCTRRGGVCAAIAVQRGSTACRSRVWSSTECSASCRSWAKCCGRGSTVRRSCGVPTYPRQTEQSGPWAFPRCATGWCRWRQSWCWSRSSRRISIRARTAFGPGAVRRWRWSDSGNWATAAPITCWMPTSATISAASSTTSCSPWWVSASATGGCSWCISGCQTATGRPRRRSSSACDSPSTLSMSLRLWGVHSSVARSE